MRQVKINDLQAKLTDFLKTYFSADAAQKSTEVMMWAELHHKTGQGLLKLLGTEPLQGVVPDGAIKVINKTPVSAIIEAHRQPSFYAAQTATDIVIEKAAQHGFAVVGVNGIYSSTGALGFYAERMAKQDLIGIVMARAPATTAPFGAATALFGTNPLAIGFPTEGNPILFDITTSAITWYELVLAKMRGLPIPTGVAIDSRGALTTDAAQAMKGAILPFDKSHKGSGLAMMVELMSGPLVGASYCDYQTFDKDWGLFIMGFRPDLLIDTADFKRHASNLRDIVKDQPSLDDKNSVRLPGEAGYAHAEKATARGLIEIEDEIAALLKF